MPRIAEVRSLIWLLSAALWAGLGGGAFAQGKRVALVVGNVGYLHVARLANPGNDAVLMAATLKATGFTLIGGGAQVDLTKPKFDADVAEFGRAIQGADVALLYYSGHGLQVNGVNYLVPVDANPTRTADLDFQMVSADVVLHQFGEGGAKLNLLILDACRNNPFGGRGLRAANGGLGEMRAPEGTLISFATQPGNVASDGAGKDSPFTVALVTAIRTPGLDLLRLFNRVGLDVKKATGGDQQPWQSSSPLDGDFYFVPPAAGTAAQAAPAAPTPSPAPQPAPVAPAPQPVAAAAMKPVAAVKPAMAPVADSGPAPGAGFECPRAGTVTTQNGQTYAWTGADPKVPTVCLVTIGGQPQRRFLGFLHEPPFGAARVADSLNALFRNETKDIQFTVDGPPLSGMEENQKTVALSKMGAGTVKIAGTDVACELIDASLIWRVKSYLNWSNREIGVWHLCYDRASAVFVSGRFEMTYGLREYEPDDWGVSAIKK